MESVLLFLIKFTDSIICLFFDGLYDVVNANETIKINATRFKYIFYLNKNLIERDIKK